MFYSETTGGFYTHEIHGDKIPSDAVEITSAEHAALIEGQSYGKVIASGPGGSPALQDPIPPEPLTREQIETLRLRAYADPLTGSDRYFAEAARLQAMGAPQEEVGAAKEAGTTRYEEIQAQYPWPA